MRSSTRRASCARRRCSSISRGCASASSIALLGDLVEDDALRLLQSRRLLDMPGDSLALAVGVGREIDLVGLLGRLLYLLDDLALLGGTT
jgi:hypothetical protein